MTLLLQVQIGLTKQNDSTAARYAYIVGHAVTDQLVVLCRSRRILHRPVGIEGCACCRAGCVNTLNRIGGAVNVHAGTVCRQNTQVVTQLLTALTGLHILRQLLGKYPGSTVVINVGLNNGQGRILVGEITLYHKDILCRERSIATDGVILQSQVVIGRAEFADIITTDSGSRIDCAVTNDLDIVSAGSIIIDIPIAIGQAVILHCEVDALLRSTVGAAAHHAVSHHLRLNRFFRFGSQLRREPGCKHPVRTVMINIGLIDIQCGIFILEFTFHNENILGSKRPITANGIAFQSQVIVCLAKLADIIAANLSRTINLTVTNDLDIIGRGSIVVNIPVFAEGQTVVAQLEMDAAICCTAFMTAQNAVIRIGEIRSLLRCRCQFLGKLLSKHPGIAVVINIGFLNCNDIAFVAEIALNNENIFIGDRCGRADGVFFQSQVIIRLTPLDNIVTICLCCSIDLSVADDLNIVGAGSIVVNLPVAVIRHIVFPHGEVDTLIGSTVRAEAHHALAQHPVIIGCELNIVNINIILFKLSRLKLTAQVKVHTQTCTILHNDHFEFAGIALGPVALVAVVPNAVLLHCPVAVAVVPLSVGFALGNVKHAVCNGNTGSIHAVAEHIHSGIFNRQFSGKGQIHRHPCTGL